MSTEGQEPLPGEAGSGTSARGAIPQHGRSAGGNGQTAMILLRAGEFITCENGHLIAEVIAPIAAGDRNYAGCVGHWRIPEPPNPGDRDPRCPCGARYWDSEHIFHVKGRGWVSR